MPGSATEQVGNDTVNNKKGYAPKEETYVRETFENKKKKKKKKQIIFELTSNPV